MKLARRVMIWLAEHGFLISGLNMRAIIRIEKYREGEKVPYTVLTTHHNKFLITGMNQIWHLVVHSSVAHYEETEARVGTGTDATAEDEAQTGLIANPVYKGMDAGYPVHTTNKTCVFKGTFGAADANQLWTEFVVDNGAISGISLVRIVSNKGTKVVGETWILQITCALANP